MSRFHVLADILKKLAFGRNIEIKNNVFGLEKVSDGFQLAFLDWMMYPPPFDPLAAKGNGTARSPAHCSKRRHEPSLRSSWIQKGRQ
jgi:hypothetical protein